MSRMKPIVEKIRDHLSRKTERTESGCLIWMGPTDPGGYGKMDFEHGPSRMRLRAHRASYELAHGPIPPGKFVCHVCDVRRCCEPTHLFLGDVKLNHEDMVSKGRRRNRGQSELQDEVRRLLLDGAPAAYIRARLGVSQSDINRRAAELWFEQKRAVTA